MSTETAKFIYKVYIINLIDFASLGNVVIWKCSKQNVPFEISRAYKENLVYFPMCISNFYRAFQELNSHLVFLF